MSKSSGVVKGGVGSWLLLAGVGFIAFLSMSVEGGLGSDPERGSWVDQFKAGYNDESAAELVVDVGGL